MWLGLRDRISCVCPKVPTAGLADREGSGDTHSGVQLCQGHAMLGPKQSVSVLERAVFCLFSDYAPLLGAGVCRTEATSFHRWLLALQGTQKLRLLPK